METVLDNVTDGLADAGELVMDAVIGTDDGSSGGRAAAGRLRPAPSSVAIVRHRALAQADRRSEDEPGGRLGLIPRPWRSTRSTPTPSPTTRPKLPRKRDVDGPDFFAFDMRAGVVVSVEPFPEARKPAWKIEVDFGPVVGRRCRSRPRSRTTPPSELLGRTVVGAINLGERRIAGFRSQFLILGALDADGTVRLLELPDGVEPGSPVA